MLIPIRRFQETLKENLFNEILLCSDLKSNRCYNVHEMIDLMNDLFEENEWLKSVHFTYDVLKENKKLKEANDKLQFLTVDMLDYIKEKDTVTHQEMKEWWNKRVME